MGFRVSTSPAGTNGNPLLWTHDDSTDSTAETQSLGILYPNELNQGVKLVRTLGSGSNRVNDLVDEYSFQTIVESRFAFLLESNRLPAHARLEVLNEDGTTVLKSAGINEPLILILGRGSYRVRISGWDPTSVRSINYLVSMVGIRQNDNPPALFSGPAPVVGIRLAPISGPGGVDSGNGGLVGGGSSGSSSGRTGSGTSSGLPGISRIDTTLSRLYLDQSGVTRITLPADSSNLAIAIPTLHTNYGGGVGSALQFARSGRKGSTLRDGLAPSGLSELADGPVGKAHGVSKDSSANLTAVQKLSTLINSALKTKSETTADDRPQNSTDNRSPEQQVVESEGETEQLHYEAVDRAAQEAQGAALPSDANKWTTQDGSSPLNTDLRGVHNGAVEADLRFNVWQNCVSIPANFSGESNLTDMNSSAALSLPDRVFAAGMGLIAASTVLRPAPTIGLSGTRRATTQLDWQTQPATLRSAPRVR